MKFGNILLTENMVIGTIFTVVLFFFLIFLFFTIFISNISIILFIIIFIIFVISFYNSLPIMMFENRLLIPNIFIKEKTSIIPYSSLFYEDIGEIEKYDDYYVLKIIGDINYHINIDTERYPIFNS